MSGTDEAAVSCFGDHCHEAGRDRIRGLAEVLRPMLVDGIRLVDVGSRAGPDRVHRDSRERQPGAMGMVVRRADDTFIALVPLSHRD